MKRNAITFLLIFTILIFSLPNYSYASGSDSLLLAGVITNDINLVRTALEQGASPNSCNDDGMTPLMLSCFNNGFFISKTLIENGADINAKDNSGKTPLIFSMYKGDYNTTKLLILAGANVNVADNEGTTPKKLSELFTATDLPQLINQALSGNLKVERQVKTASVRKINSASYTNNNTFGALVDPSKFDMRDTAPAIQQPKGKTKIIEVPSMPDAEERQAVVDGITQKINSEYSKDSSDKRPTNSSSEKLLPRNTAVSMKTYNMSDRVEMSTFKGEFMTARINGKSRMAFECSDGQKYIVSDIKTSNRLKGNRSDESFDDSSLVNGKKFKVSGYLVPGVNGEATIDIRSYEEN